MQALMIDNEVKRDAQRVIKFAEANVYSMDDLLDIHNGESGKIAGNILNHTFFIPFGVRVVYSLEDQPSGLIRHMSVSVDRIGELPSVESVMLIMKLMGFKSDLMDCIIKLEDFAPGRQAVNVYEIIE